MDPQWNGPTSFLPSLQSKCALGCMLGKGERILRNLSQQKKNKGATKWEPAAKKASILFLFLPDYFSMRPRREKTVSLFFSRVPAE